MYYELSVSSLPLLAQAMSRLGTLYLPGRRGNGTEYVKYERGTEADLETLRTVTSPKNVFFPQVEPLLKFRTDGKKLAMKAEAYADEPTIIFGVRACDVRSFELLDRVFLPPPTDGYYAARREHCTIVALACAEPDENCFCRSFGIDAGRPHGDVSVWKIENVLYWKALTEKGEALTSRLAAAGVLAENRADAAARTEAQAAQTENILSQLPLGEFKVNPKIPADELKTFGSAVWDELSKGCLACCTCTYVCPTCHCYDVRDYDAGNGRVERYRCWDSCMAADFTKMAGGNPRKTKKERFRQRYMHKLVYYPENQDGIFMCVGCGRCLEKCPMSLNIVKVAKALEVTPDV